MSIEVRQQPFLGGSGWRSKHGHRASHLLGKGEILVELLVPAGDLTSPGLALPAAGEVSVGAGAASRMLLVAFSFALAALLAAVP